jgi:hypothetical protein
MSGKQLMNRRKFKCTPDFTLECEHKAAKYYHCLPENFPDLKFGRKKADFIYPAAA